MLRPPFSQEQIPINNWDVIVIGAGAAGLMTCLELPAHLKVLLLNRNTSKVSSSRWAQGGIASVIREDDSFELHADDTLKAGDGLCDLQAVEMLVKEAPGCVDRLQNLGMIFDQSFDQLATTLEAAHSRRRVLHVKDRTGRALVEVLEDHVENKKNILHCRGVRVTELLIENEECKGVQVLDGANLYWIQSRAVVLATGGGGHLFTNTTNPAQSSGEGIALAWKAGAAIEDLEFVQFHPTALKFYGAPCFLISEALRGEGAILVDKNGESPVKNLKNRDLATRDQVSRAIMKNMHDNNVDHVGLDLRYIDPEKIVERFPTILSRCQEYGVNPLNEVIPVAPAAHYWMGGVKTDLNASSTRKGLYAVGEVASTGVHGANRLASNSLMECLVFARKMSSIVLNYPPKFEKLDRSIQDLDIEDPKEDQISKIAEKIDELRKLCWSNLGVSRNKVNMSKFLDTIKNDMAHLQKNYLLNSLEKIRFDQRIKLSEPNRRSLNLLLDLKNRQITTITLLKACLFREESRGGHYRDDFPDKDKNWECHTTQQLDQKIKKRFIKN
ncbi:L-aspartate oxidase [Prochlorococcus marinus str. MU1404]|uniref:L-aspartate oxidase n=1 Tax=Prochlorococcus marinus TaxID=1219 RepID=UPI001ADA1A27|nr:L-aspartate oxidase [Prochlorococcus marinus]MBO8229271.1 L-aspartate oxidase [Prochlorococcus marinus XMU1404]MBW3072353.1 L-aspartate oxidase [Prochlorococcus marinus str. MU1404]MCR8544546.1 L-aspartate oxidase [Prochlorococcus marinus CUG1432]